MESNFIIHLFSRQLFTIHGSTTLDSTLISEFVIGRDFSTKFNDEKYRNIRVLEVQTFKEKAHNEKC